MWKVLETVARSKNEWTRCGRSTAFSVIQRLLPPSIPFHVCRNWMRLTPALKRKAKETEERKGRREEEKKGRREGEKKCRREDKKRREEKNTGKLTRF